MLHSRSKPEPHATGPTLRHAASNLRVQTPTTGAQSTSRKPPLNASSTSGSASGSPASPTKPSSRIPRIPPAYEASTKASSLKRSQSVKSLKDPKGSGTVRSSHAAAPPQKLSDSRAGLDPSKIPLPRTPIMMSLPRHVRTLDSGGKTPIIHAPAKTNEQPSVNAKVASYLNDVDPNMHPDHTPFTEEEAVSDASLGGQSSRKTSTSTVKAPKDNDNKRQAINVEPEAASHFIFGEDKSSDPILKDPAIVYSGKKVDMSGSSGIYNAPAEVPKPVYEATDASSQLAQDDHKLRGRSDQFIPRNRPHSPSVHSMRSKGSSELRATAPEFVPQPHDEMQAPTLNAMTTNTQWMQPFDHNLAFDPFAVDAYGMPWFFHMYPVQMKQRYKSPKKLKTMPRGRKQGDTSSSPNKTSEHPPQEEHSEKQAEGTQDAVVPFAAQLDEISRNAPARQDNGEEGASSPMRRGYHTISHRSGRPLRQFGNGLYDTFGRGRFRPVGMPIEATAPFPDPVPPSGRKAYVRYAIERTQDGCGAADIDRAAEWVGNSCNNCEPDH
ncbi:hypothetical protein BU23DRAFT_549600 [Bimuria novae-zelandiae CBS 107.79]|uniref:Uncharacterized protein n=1 Tax=Bimuria novae-zelandiae CBS 107.79 TaxID=1447943 RepID=A0A6A5VVJ2_9PLEO|nr:hypothetical protein BU23DRAFT_549600 [Bimuria novae-zelandiae CBS 107.79]